MKTLCRAHTCARSCVSVSGSVFTLQNQPDHQSWGQLVKKSGSPARLVFRQVPLARCRRCRCCQRSLRALICIHIGVASVDFSGHFDWCLEVPGELKAKRDERDNTQNLCGRSTFLLIHGAAAHREKPLEKTGAIGLISGLWYLLEELLLQLPFAGNEGSSSRDLIHAAYQFDLHVFHGEWSEEEIISGVYNAFSIQTDKISTFKTSSYLHKRLLVELFLKKITKGN